MTTSGHSNLPDEQGNAHAPAVTGSGLKTTTDHAKSDPGERGSGPRTATDLAEIRSESELNENESGQKTAIDPTVTACGKTATEKSLDADALESLTVSGKWSESESDETGQESCLTKSGLSDPSLFLEPKIGKHWRIANRSGPPKSLSTHHLAERAVMSGERQPRKQSGQQVSAANEQLPPHQLPKEQTRQKRTRAHRTSVQRHFHPSRWT